MRKEVYQTNLVNFPNVVRCHWNQLNSTDQTYKSKRCFIHKTLGLSTYVILKEGDYLLIMFSKLLKQKHFYLR